MDESEAHRFLMIGLIGVCVATFIFSFVFSFSLPKHTWLLAGVFCFAFGFLFSEGKKAKESKKKALERRNVEETRFYW